jgi:hypothetical protein
VRVKVRVKVKCLLIAEKFNLYICPVEKKDQKTKSALRSNTQIAIHESFSCIDNFLQL